jgi:hypothetical protein
LSRSLPDDFNSRLSIYFQNVNRLRNETSDLFKAVLENDYDVIVLLETSLVSSFYDEELFDSKCSVLRCDCSLSTSSRKSGGSVLITVKRMQDVILILSDFNLPKVKWKVKEESGSMIPLNVKSDLESDLIGGLFGCDLDQIN